MNRFLKFLIFLKALHLCFAFLMINDGFNDYDYDSQARSAVHIIIAVTDKNLSELIAFEDNDYGLSHFRVHSGNT